MTTLSEKNEDLEAGGSPSPVKLRRNKNDKSQISIGYIDSDSYMEVGNHLINDELKYDPNQMNQHIMKFGSSFDD